MTRDLVHRIRSELGSRAALAVPAVSRYLAAATAAPLLETEQSSETLAARFRRDRRALLVHLIPLAERAAHGAVAPILSLLRRESLLDDAPPEDAFHAPDYQERIVHLALEECLVHAAAPPLLVSPVPEPGLERALAAITPVAVVFDYPLAITHELYPLATDLYVFTVTESASALPPLSLVGVHASWLNRRGEAGRAILFDPERDLFLEAPLTAASHPAAALLLALSSPAHAEIGIRLEEAGVPYLNSQALAATADDKWDCFCRWQAAGVNSPETCLLPATESVQEIRRTVKAFLARAVNAASVGWVIQPRHGTEGQGVALVAANAAAIGELLRAWEEIASSDDAILRPRVGLTGIAAPAGPLAFDLRLHICYDGSVYGAESGYLLVAGSPDQPITSVARGGRTRPYRLLDEVGLAKPDGFPTPWLPRYLEEAQALAIAATAALGPLGLAGIDLKFDWRSDGVQATVLDLNPRPAGLLHANLISGDEAGIAAGLWRRIRQLTAPA